MPAPDDDRDLMARLDRLGEWCQPRRASWAELRPRLAGLPAGRPGPTAWRPGSLAVTAVVLVAAGVGTILGLGRPPRPGPHDSGEFSGTPIAGLAPGVAVQPARNARFRVIGPRRVQLETGALLVAVDQDESEPDLFQVATPAGEARARGTWFLVETDPVGPETDIPSPARGEREMNSGFLTRVVVLAGLAQLATSEVTVEGRAGELLAAEAGQGPEGPWTQMHVYELRALQSEKTIEELGLTKEQKRQVEELLAEYKAVWQEHFAASSKCRQDMRRQAFAELTARQKEVLEGLEFTKRMWFTAIQWPDSGTHIGLDEEQRKRLDAVLADHVRKRTEAFQSVRKGTTEEMVKRSREVQRQYRDMVEEAKRAVRSILTDEQFDALITEVAVMQLPDLVRQKRFSEQLGLAEAQIARIEALQRATEADIRQRGMKAWENRRELGELVRQVLTPQQKERLQSGAGDSVKAGSRPH